MEAENTGTENDGLKKWQMCQKFRGHVFISWGQ